MRTEGIRLLRLALRAAPWLTIALPAGLIGLCMNATAWVVLGQFHTRFLLPSSILAVGVVLWLIKGMRPAHRSPTASIIDIVVILGAVAWAGVNIPFSGQHLLTDRDPATYAVTGVWLTTHHDLRIPKPAGFSSVPGVTADSLGFNSDLSNSGDIDAQGAHGLPALLGLLGRLLGLRAVLYGNILFGALALLAFYGFGRLVIGRKWAAIATLALSVSLPLIYFSRDAYTEPLTLLCVFTALALLYHGMTSRDLRIWAAAGVSAGTAALLRLDALPFLATLELFVIWYIASAPAPMRAVRLRQSAAAVIPAVLLALLGWLDVSQLSTVYYQSLHTEVVRIVAAALLLAIAAPFVVLLCWRTQVLSRASKLARTRTATAGLAGVLAIGFATLFVRGVWLFMLAVTGRANSMPVQQYASGTTLLWVLWYIGPVLGLAGIAAFVLGWPKLLAGRMRAVWLPLFLVLTAECGLYLLDPEISADQVWASRRFLPIIFPCLVLFGAFALSRLGQTVAAWKKLRAYRLFIPGMGAGLAVVCVLATSAPFLAIQSFAQLGFVTRLCRQLPDDAVVVWLGQEGGFMTQPLQSTCGVESLSIVTADGDSAKVVVEQLGQLARIQHKTLYIAARAEDAALLPAGAQKVARETLTYTEPEHTYKRFPVATISDTVTVLLEKIGN